MDGHMMENAWKIDVCVCVCESGICVCVDVFAVAAACLAVLATAVKRKSVRSSGERSSMGLLQCKGSGREEENEEHHLHHLLLAAAVLGLFLPGSFSNPAEYCYFWGLGRGWVGGAGQQYCLRDCNTFRADLLRQVGAMGWVVVGRRRRLRFGRARGLGRRLAL